MKRWWDSPQRGRLPIEDHLDDCDVVFSAFMDRNSAWLDFTKNFDYDPEDDYDPNYDEAAFEECLKQTTGMKIWEEERKGKRSRGIGL